MEVLSDSTEKYDRTEKMDLYKRVEVAEYWLVNWRKKQVEIYLLTPDENTLDEMDYTLVDTITEENKSELEIKTFPNVKVDFDELFNI